MLQAGTSNSEAVCTEICTATLQRVTDTCDLAIDITNDLDGVVFGTITDPNDDAPGCGGTSSAERVYRLTPMTTGYLFLSAASTSLVSSSIRWRRRSVLV